MTSFADNVTVAIGTNPRGGTLAGTKSVAATAGTATFTGPDSLSMDRAGVGYKLRVLSGEVTAYDVQGNKATNFNGEVTVAIDTDPVGGSQHGGTKTVTAVSGVATFSTLTIDQVGSGFKLNAAFGGPPVVASALFDIL